MKMYVVYQENGRPTRPSVKVIEKALPTWAKVGKAELAVIDSKDQGRCYDFFVFGEFDKKSVLAMFHKLRTQAKNSKRDFSFGVLDNTFTADMRVV